MIVEPLHNLTKKKVKFEWTPKEENAFNAQVQAYDTTSLKVS